MVEETAPPNTPRRRSSPRSLDEEAARMLARRPLSESELTERLRRRGFDGEAIAAVIAGFRERRYLDDARLALDFIVARAASRGHGPERLVRDLARRGVPADVARAAWQQAVELGSLEPAELLAGRLRRELAREGGRLEDRGFRRIYNALIRAGFDGDAVAAALEPHRESST